MDTVGGSLAGHSAISILQERVPVTASPLAKLTYVCALMHAANLQVADRTRTPALTLKVRGRVGQSPWGEEGG